MLLVSALMTGFLWWKIGSSSEYRGTGSVERFEEFAEVDESRDKDEKAKGPDSQPAVATLGDGAVEVRGVELDNDGRQRY
jgi:hypothetical protein